MADDPFADVEYDEGDEGSKSGSDENKSFRDLRKAYNATKKERDAFEAELSELREFRAGVVEKEKESAIASAFTEVGLNPAHGKLFKALNPEVTPDQITAEAVAKFAAEYSLVTAEGTPVSAPDETPSGFRPAATTGSAARSTLTMDDVHRMLRNGETEAVEAAFRDGRVEKDPVPWTVVSS